MITDPDTPDTPGKTAIRGNAPIYSAGLSDDSRCPSVSTPMGLTARWRNVPAGWRPVIIVVMAVLLVGALVRLASAVTQGSVPEGPQSSSFSPTSDGLEAYAQLLTARGARVEQVTTSLSRTNLPGGTVVVVAAPTSWQSTSSEALEKLLEGGGRVVLAGEPPPGLLRALLGAGRAPTWSAEPIALADRASASPLVAGLGQVASTGPGTWSAIGDAEPLLSAGGAYLAVSERVGGGTLVLLASPTPLQNHLIGQADNAAFSVDIGLAPAKVVAFDEYDHGFGQVGGGLAGLPAYWKAGLIIAFAAVVLWLLSAVRRFGPPEDRERVLAPPRVAYVDAVATLMSTTPPDRAASATSSLQQRGREGLCRKVGVGRDATDAEIVRAAQSTGVRNELVTAVLSSPRTVDELVAVGRASAELSRERPS